MAYKGTSREEEHRYTKQMEREESKVRLSLWCRVLTDSRRWSWGH